MLRRNMLSRSAEYALRIMAHFALHKDNTPLRAQDIAESVHIPIFYLSKILRRMVTGGLLKATKGHGGGFLIAKPANKIRFSHILEAIEGGVTERSCVFGLDACSDNNPCMLHNRWREVRSAFETWARETTLEHVKSDAKSLIIPTGKISLKERIRNKPQKKSKKVA